MGRTDPQPPVAAAVEEEGPSPIELVAQLLAERGVVIPDVPQATKFLLLGFTIGRQTPPWKHAVLERLVDTFFPSV